MEKTEQKSTFLNSINEFLNKLTDSDKSEEDIAETKKILLDNLKKSLDKSEDDIAEIYEEMHKIKVSVNTLLLLLIKKVIFTEKEFKEEMKNTRKRIRVE